MKRILNFVYVIVFIAILFACPNNVFADVDWNNSGLKCSDIEGSNEVIGKTCTIYFTITENNYDKNGLNIDLSLTNMTIHSIKLENDWKLTSQNSTNLKLETKASNLTVGKHTVGTITFYKIKSADECKVTYKFNFSKINRSCIYQDGIYYDKEGKIVGKAEFSLYCEVHKCVILINEMHTHYFDDEGNETNQSDYEEKCLEVHYCEYKDGLYYDNDGKLTDKTNYEKNV